MVTAIPFAASFESMSGRFEVLWLACIVAASGCYLSHTRPGHTEVDAGIVEPPLPCGDSFAGWTRQPEEILDERVAAISNVAGAPDRIVAGTIRDALGGAIRLWRVAPGASTYVELEGSDG